MTDQGEGGGIGGVSRRPEGDARKDAPISTGSLNLAPVASGTEGTTRWYIVEQDVPSDALADVATSLKGMERLVG